jgi:hypothetical protein
MAKNTQMLEISGEAAGGAPQSVENVEAALDNVETGESCSFIMSPVSKTIRPR